MEKELERTEAKAINKKPVRLEGDAAILKWLEGADAWNKWMEENPNTDVDFSRVDFSYKVLKKRFPDNENLYCLMETHKAIELVSFQGYIFNRHVIFAGAEFVGTVMFNNTIFNGTSNFEGAIFGVITRFDHATFRKCASFGNTTFRGSVSFNKAEFFDFTYFKHAILGDESFLKKAALKEATFSVGMSFSGAKFSGDANFNNAKLNGKADFDKAIFKGKADFFDVDFDDDVSFYLTILGSNPNFASSNFNSKSRFEPLNAKTIRALNFKGASFEKHFSLKGKFKCIPELRQTKTSHHVDLSNLEVKLNRDFINKFWRVEKAPDKEDSERLCRLKEIAESSKNNERALAFHADEMRAKRLWNRQTWLKDILDCYYSVTSNYGQSIARPFCLLVLSIFMFALFTMSQAKADKTPRFKDAVTVSIATVTPFISISKGARDKGLSRLYGENIPDDYDLYSYLHAGISFVFIFLIGLGLRNRFRI